MEGIHENFFGQRSVIGITMEVEELPHPLESAEEQKEENQEQQQQEGVHREVIPLLLVQEILLAIKFQIECFHFFEAENGTRTLIKRHQSMKEPYTDRSLPVKIFTPGGKTLQRYLSSLFEFCDDGTIDAEQAAKDIIERWVEIRNDKEKELCGGVDSGTAFLDLEVTVKFWITSVFYAARAQPISNEEDDDDENDYDYFGYGYGIQEEEEEEEEMVSASKAAIRKMLKRKKKEELLEEDEECPICLKELEKRMVLEMPCSHRFHEWCIRIWLKRSNLCPICRFALPKSTK